ncbi:hypothetical protein [Planomonospora sp. ID82291]|uniref:hypothetical protein n=1 Tax=Planomonospora sp. ID82291 TaxID=2738136 RepID=UPI0018C35AEF|nr:hypothetical protein [Planomonospora sp. ID82291]MBG0819135.1 hypothetical protein [Planomonospora sp. ID82291]
MGLKPEVSLPVALATGALVYGIYSNALPPVVDIRTAAANHPDVASAEKGAAWTAAAAVAAISLLSKDMTVFIVGGGMVVAMSWFHTHANAVNPEWGVAVPRPGGNAEAVEEMSSAEDYASEFAAA